MNATDELRRLLTEAGVVWWNQTDPEPQTVTMARLGDQLIEYHENVNGTMGYHVWNMRELTPAQAIAATLGDVPCLPYFWTADDMLHVELPKLPESISVRLPDQRDREVGSARTWQYTQGSGTCREVYLLMATDIGDGREEVLGAYATESAAMKAISENQFGYALHHVRKWEVDE